MHSSCGIFSFNLASCFWSFIPWWAPYVFWGIIALLILGALTRVYSLFGWPGILAIMSTIAFVAGFIVGRKASPQGTTVLFPGHASPVPVKRPNSGLPPKSLTE